MAQIKMLPQMLGPCFLAGTVLLSCGLSPQLDQSDLGVGTATSSDDGAANTTNLANSASQQPNKVSSANVATAPTNDYNVVACLADLEQDMAYAGDSNNMNLNLRLETAAAVLSAAQRYYPELPLKTVARIMIANIRQESDFQPGAIGGQRDGSGSAYGLLQVSPYGDSQELTLFVNHADVTGLVDYRSQTALDVHQLTVNDLKDPWINLHIATWIQANLARSGSADPGDWGRKQGPKPSNYLTGLGSWVAGPAADGSTGYGGQGDNASANYFKGILHEYNFLTGFTNTTDALAGLAVSPNVVRFVP